MLISARTRGDSRRRRGATVARSTMAPAAATRSALAAAAGRNPQPSVPISTRPKYAPSMSMAPWLKLMISSTLNTSEKPTAISA